MKVLVACEESQTVCKAFRKRGHEAYSCDIMECSGGHPEWHIKGDVLNVLNPTQLIGVNEFGIVFETMDGLIHDVEKWDLIIAHPPCTYLCMSSQKHCNVEVYGQKAVERIAKRDEAVEFFMQFVNADCKKIAIENPVGVMTRNYRKADQYIQPLQFGHPTSKKNGFVVKGFAKTCSDKYSRTGVSHIWNGKKMGQMVLGKFFDTSVK